MPLLLLFAFVPAIIVISLAVMLISGTITFLTNRSKNIDYEFGKFCGNNFTQGFVQGCQSKMKEIKDVQKAKKTKIVETIDVVILKEK